MKSVCRAGLAGIVAAGVAGGAMPALAGDLGSLDLQFVPNNTGTYGPTRMTSRIMYDGDGDGTYELNKNVGVGQMHFRVTATDTGELGDQLFDTGDIFTTFCTDIFQAVQINQDEMSIVNVEDAPDSGTPMGGFKATLLRGLFASHLNDGISSSTTRLAAATFQALVWEIVNEEINESASSASELGIDLADGRFKMDNSAIANEALTWVDDIWTQRNNWFNLWAAVDNNGQDQLLYLIPAPPAIGFGLAGIGLLGLAGGRRRKA